jgi:hypothetical protein
MLLTVMIAASGLMTAAAAQTVAGNVTSLSASQPKLTVAGTAWGPLDVAQGDPNASKGGIVVQFVPDNGDLAAFPLNSTTATVTLRPSGAGPVVNCTRQNSLDPLPALSPTNAGQCFFRVMAGTGDKVQIHYLGLLARNEDIRYQINGMQAAIGGFTFQNFDSDTVIGPKPQPTTGRKPARLVLVFDKSGSMAWTTKPTDATCGPYYSPNLNCQRWNILKLAAAQLTNVAKAYAISGDQLGVVFFDSTATDTGDIAAMTTTTLNAVGTALTSQAPGGSTSLGAGVERLKSGILTNNANFNNMVLVFTDGEQNTAPFLVSDGTQLLINPTQNQPFGTAYVPAGNTIGLCTFRLRTDDPAGPIGSTTLQEIANRGCSGLMNAPSSLDAQPAPLIQFFLQVLDNTLIGDKLELISHQQGSQSPVVGAGSPVDLTFTLSKEEAAFSLLVNWEGIEVSLTGLTLSKDGVDFTLPQEPLVQTERGHNHLVFTLRVPYCNSENKCVQPEGTWKLHFLPYGQSGSNFTYNLFVIGDNRTLSTSYGVSQTTPGVGEPLALRAELKEAGQPLTGLPAGAVRVLVSGPSAGLGNILSASKQKPTEGPNSPDTLSQAALKVQAMLADPAERATLLKALEQGAEQGIPLTETSPGVYTAAFPATLAEGIYKLGFRVTATAPGNGAFTRMYDTDFYVPVVPDPKASIATLSTTTITTGCTSRGGCVAFTLKPTDAKGNLVGPGKASIFGLTKFNGQLLEPVKDNLDGTYTIAVGYPTRDTKPPVIQIGGTAIPLPDRNGSLRGLLKWWWVLVLVLLAAIVFLILQRSLRRT